MLYVVPTLCFVKLLCLFGYACIRVSMQYKLYSGINRNLELEKKTRTIYSYQGGGSIVLVIFSMLWKSILRNKCLLRYCKITEWRKTDCPTCASGVSRQTIQQFLVMEAVASPQNNQSIDGRCWSAWCAGFSTNLTIAHVTLIRRVFSQT